MDRDGSKDFKEAVEDLVLEVFAYSMELVSGHSVSMKCSMMVGKGLGHPYFWTLSLLLPRLRVTVIVPSLMLHFIT
jgi:hypothetical protein